MLKEWFVEQIRSLLTNEGSPTLRIIANIIGSFLVYACYLLFSGLTQKLKVKYPGTSGSLETRVVEKILAWGTIVLIAILLGTSILSAIQLLIKAFPGASDGTGTIEMSLKQAVVINLNHFKHVALYVFGSMLLMAILTAGEVGFIFSDFVGRRWFANRSSLGAYVYKGLRWAILLLLIAVICVVAVIPIGSPIIPPSVNHPPFIAAIEDLTVNEGETVDIPIVVTDPDKDLHKVTASGSPRLPPGLRFAPSLGKFLISGTVGHDAVTLPDLSTDFIVTITADDGKDTATQTFTITVYNVELLFSIDNVDIGTTDPSGKLTISTELRQAFASHRLSLSSDATISAGETENTWLIANQERTYTIRKAGRKLNLYLVSNNVGTRIGRFIIFAAGPWETKNNPLWPTTAYLANMVYKVSRSRGYPPQAIQYLSANILEDVDNDNIPDVDDLAARENLKKAITNESTVAFFKQNPQSQLVLYITGHSEKNSIILGTHESPVEENLTAEDLATWLEELEEKTELNEIIIVIDGSHSGSFIEVLKGPRRYIITSTDESSNAIFDRDGQLSFSKFFFDNISRGSSIGESFLRASEVFRNLDPPFNQQNPQISPNETKKVNKVTIGKGSLPG